MEVLSIIGSGIELISGISSIYDNFMKNTTNLLIAEANRKLQVQLEAGRQNFEIKKLEATFVSQNALIQKEHEMRMEEQQKNFELLCNSEQWKIFLQNWPLLTPPMVIRDCQYLNDGRVCLQVFLNKSNNKRYAKSVYPFVEQGLKDFVNLYAAAGARNLLFHQSDFKEGFSGSAINQNLWYVLKEMPVLVIDTDVVNDELYISTTIWGIGSGEKSQGTEFKLKFQPDGKGARDYLQFSRKVLACLKFLVGSVYDLYNLMEYDKEPLLPEVMEQEGEGEGAILFYSELRNIIGNNYMGIYKLVLGSDAAGESLRTTRLHSLRLKYAKAIESFLDEEEMSDCLHDSLMSWIRLRSDKTVVDFLRYVDNEPELIRKYFSEDDIFYFHDLAALFGKHGKSSKYQIIRSLILNVDKQLSIGQGKLVGDIPIIDVDLYQKNYVGIDIPDETNKHYLTIRAKNEIQKENYSEAAELLREVAKICHAQKKEHDAYLLEHNAFLCEQKSIYKKADVPLDAFGGVPNVAILQETLTKLSDRAFSEKKFDLFVYYKTLNARLCRAQGKERDAFLLENSAYAYRDFASEITKKKRETREEQEAQMLRKLADEYMRRVGKN